MNNTDYPSQFKRRDFLNSFTSDFAVVVAGGAILEFAPGMLGQAEEATGSLPSKSNRGREAIFK